MYLRKYVKKSISRLFLNNLSATYIHIKEVNNAYQCMFKYQCLLETQWLNLSVFVALKFMVEGEKSKNGFPWILCWYQWHLLVTNSVLNHKSKGNIKKHTDLIKKGGRKSCHGGVNILCSPVVTPAMCSLL